MKRVYLTSAIGWFNIDTSESIDEKTYWDGHNSCGNVLKDATRSQILECTKSNRYILCTFSQWQGEQTTIVEISEDSALNWLVKNKTQPEELENLPKVKKLFESFLDGCEL